MTVKVRPAIINEPVRCAPVFGAAVKVTVPLPTPAAAEEIVSQAALLVAVQAQPAVVVTVIEVPEPPAPPTVWLVGLIE